MCWVAGSSRVTEAKRMLRDMLIELKAPLREKRKEWGRKTGNEENSHVTFSIEERGTGARTPCTLLWKLRTWFWISTSTSFIPPHPPSLPYLLVLVFFRWAATSWLSRGTSLFLDQRAHIQVRRRMNTVYRRWILQNQYRRPHLWVVYSIRELSCNCAFSSRSLNFFQFIFSDGDPIGFLFLFFASLFLFQSFYILFSNIYAICAMCVHLFALSSDLLLIKVSQGTSVSTPARIRLYLMSHATTRNARVLRAA